PVDDHQLGAYFASGSPSWISGRGVFHQWSSADTSGTHGVDPIAARLKLKHPVALLHRSLPRRAVQSKMFSTKRDFGSTKWLGCSKNMLLRNHSGSAGLFYLLAASRRASACSGRDSCADPMISSSCATLVALAMGAVSPGRDCNRARATWEGLAASSSETSSKTCKLPCPRSSKYLVSMPALAVPSRSSRLLYFPVRKPLAREK